jgi:hypothetical protein
VEGHGSKPTIRNDIQIPQGWVVRTEKLRNGQLISVCGGCATPNYCAGIQKCHRGVTFGHIARYG